MGTVFGVERRTKSTTSSESSLSCAILIPCSLARHPVSLLVSFSVRHNDVLLLPPDFPHTPALHTSSTSILTSTVNLLCPHSRNSSLDSQCRSSSSAALNRHRRRRQPFSILEHCRQIATVIRAAHSLHVDRKIWLRSRLDEKHKLKETISPKGLRPGRRRAPRSRLYKSQPQDHSNGGRRVPGLAMDVAGRQEDDAR